MLDQDRDAVRKKFLQLFAELGTISAAADGAGVHRTTHYLWLEKVDGYAEAFEQAKARFHDRLEQELFRRAQDPAHKGDTALIFALKGNLPDRYGDKHQVEFANKDDRPFEISFGMPRPGDDDDKE